MWLSSSPVLMGAFSCFPTLLQECLRPRFTQLSASATPLPFHQKTLSSSHLQSLHHLCTLSLPRGLLGSASALGSATFSFRLHGDSSGKTSLTTQTHLGTSTIYSFLALHLFAEHSILTNQSFQQ